MIQTFIRAALDPCQPKVPLFIHLNDYLGNEQREILQTMELAQSVARLADYYGFTSLSYANTVRDLVYGDTKEFFFSPKGWWNGNSHEREIHPMYTAHLSMAWVVLYNMLVLTTEYCSLKNHYNMVHPARSHPHNAATWRKAAASNGVGEGVRPKPVPDSLPPPLTESLSLANVSNAWRKTNHVCPDLNQNDVRTCSFSWVSGITDLPTVQMIEKHFAPVVANATGWIVSDGRGKPGWILDKDAKANDTLVLEFNELDQQINDVIVSTMRSYGSQWQSHVELVVLSRRKLSKDWIRLNSTELVGFHGKKTSETYVGRLHLLEPVRKGDSLRVEFHLITGEAFKIMGIMVCR